MEFIFEVIADIIGDLLVETIKNNQISLWIRIPLFMIFSLLVLAIVFLLGFIGFQILKKQILASIFFLLLAIVFLGYYILLVYRFFKK